MTTRRAIQVRFMNSPSSPMGDRNESVADRTRRELLVEVDVMGHACDDRTTFAPHGTY